MTGPLESANVARASFARELRHERRDDSLRRLDHERDLLRPDGRRRDRAQVEHPGDQGIRRRARERPAGEHQRRHGEAEDDPARFAAAAEDGRAVAGPRPDDQRPRGPLGPEPADRDRVLGDRAAQRLGQLAGRPAVVAHPERGDRLCVPACMSGRRAKGDDRFAADERLEAGDAGRRVDDGIGGRHQLVHVVREAEDARARLAGEILRQALANLLVQAADADDVRALELQRRAYRAFELADSPAASGDDDHRAFLGESQRAAGVCLRQRLEELLLYEGAYDTRASRSCDPLDGTHA